MSDLDRDIIQWFQTKSKSRKPSEPVEPELAKKRKRVRTEAIGRFIMTLSDQQLVTGIGILTSSISNQAKLTGYEFSMTCGLALLSFTTTVTTLSALRAEFIHRDPIANIRIMSMTVMLVMLVYALSLNMFAYTDIPVQCVFEGVYEPLDGLTLAGNIIYLVLIIRIYYNLIMFIYFRQSASIHIAHWLRTAFEWRMKGTLLPESPGSLGYMYLNEYKSAEDREELQRIQKYRSPMIRELLFGEFRYRPDGSFLMLIPEILFSLSTGLSSTTTTRISTTAVLAKDASDMGFGQMMALLLLGSQLLSAAETYRGELL